MILCVQELNYHTHRLSYFLRIYLRLLARDESKIYSIMIVPQTYISVLSELSHEPPVRSRI